MIENFKIESPNDWLIKAGAFVRDSRLYLPHDFLLIPLAIASEAVENFNKNISLKEKIKNIQIIALNVRSVEAVFYKKVAEMLNNESKIKICEKCIKDSLFNTNLKTLRREVNSKIIHKMETGKVILPEDFHIAIDYYNEIFKLPLMDPISWEAKRISLCDNCLKKKQKTVL